MRKVILGTLVTIVVLGSVLLIERSWRLNRELPRNTSDKGQVLPGELELIGFGTKEKVSLNKFAGKVVLINFWASWCEACMAEMPSIQKLYELLHGDGFEVLAINVDEQPDKVVPGIVNRLGLKFPIFTDADGELSREFEIVAIPYSILADRKQNIVWGESGERDWSSEKVVQEIRKLLTE